MTDKHFYDITEVCGMLQTTSRTLRFYEEKGIVQSSTSGQSQRRQYTADQIAHIRNVLLLRTLGLSIKAIAELQKQDADLRSALMIKRAEIEALIDTKKKEITLLNKALMMMDEEKNIFEQDMNVTPAKNNPRIEEIIRTCNESIIKGIPEPLYEHLSDTMKEYMPLSVFEKIRVDTLLPLGEFVSVDRIEYDKKRPHIVYQYMRYEKLGLKIKYVFYEEKIHGFWLGYCEL